jgi:hypothetical protein
MGGILRLGYRAQDGKLVIIESEAEIVRGIFLPLCRTRLGPVIEERSRKSGDQSKSWTTASGRRVGGKPFKVSATG